MGNSKVFIDTNIITYAYDRDAGEKYEKAFALIKNLWKQKIPPYISTQVIQELQATLSKLGYPTNEAIRAADHYLSWNVLPIDAQLLKSSFDIRLKFQTSVWDATIIAAARHSGANELWSEDFQEGQKFGNLQVVNPFKS